MHRFRCNARIKKKNLVQRSADFCWQKARKEVTVKKGSILGWTETGQPRRKIYCITVQIDQDTKRT